MSLINCGAVEVKLGAVETRHQGLRVHQWIPSLAGTRLSTFISQKHVVYSTPQVSVEAAVTPLHFAETTVTELLSLAFHVPATFSTERAAAWRTCFFFSECARPSAPVLKSNHAHDFNMSSKETERNGVLQNVLLSPNYKTQARHIYLYIHTLASCIWRCVCVYLLCVCSAVM